MKSRLTTYLLLAAVAIIWGVIAWELLSTGSETILPAESVVSHAAVREAVADTLIIDYPDPFLKGHRPKPVTDKTDMRTRHRIGVRSSRREFPACEHIGSVRAGQITLYIVMLGGEQYEAECGDSVAGFILSGADSDSLYLVRDGVKYGVKLCK